MCMSDPVKIESKDVPKYAYKVYNIFSNKRLKTYFRHTLHDVGKFNKSNEKKKSHKTVIHCHSALHLGRISVYVHKKDAIKFCKNRNGGYYVSQTWKVEIKQTTKYTYKGRFTGETLAVDQVKPIQRVF